jgi:ABC-type transport system involved in multi-copper enzyme maturation permease subunit
VLGIMLVTSEWSQRTAMVTFTLEAHRGRIVAAKLAAGLLLALIVSLIATVSAFIINGIYAVAHGGADWHLGFLELLGFLLTQVIAMLTGFAFATLLLNTAAAIVVYFILPTGFGLLFSLVDSLAGAAAWIDISTSQAPLFDHSIHGVDWLQLLVTTTGWILLPLAAGLWRLLHREIK